MTPQTDCTQIHNTAHRPTTTVCPSPLPIVLLLVVEHDTKFLFVYAVKEHTASTVAITIFKNYCTFDSFNAIYSDPVSALISNSVRDYGNWRGIPHHVQ